MVRTGFVGREGELRQLTNALNEALAGAMRLYLVSGEPGIGKTTLADTLTAHARASDVRVVWGRAVEAGGAPAFWPWVQILRGVLGPDTTAALDERTSVVARLLPEARGAALASPDQFATEAARFELFDGVAQQLVQSAQWSPLVIVLDDLHAADLPTVQLLHFCSREIRDVPLLIIATYREADVRADVERSELIGRIAREGEAISLTGLSRPDVADVLRPGLGDDADRVAPTVHELTAGNPLFIQEVGRLLRDGTVDLDRVGSALPEGVRETIRQRLGPLAPELREIIASAAVAGVDFSVATVATACGRSRSDVLDALDQADALGLVQRDADAVGRYRFSHALVREAVYEDLGAVSRAAMHLRIAEAIERGHNGHVEAHLAELAHHFYEAAVAGTNEKATGYAQRAGRQALQLYAYEEASHQFRNALRLTRDDGERCALLLDLSEAEWKSGAHEKARKTFAEAARLARDLREPALLARAALGFGAGGYTGRVDEPLHELLEEALVVVGEGQDAIRARLLARLALELYYADPQRGRDLTAEAVTLARRTDDPATLCYVLNARRNAAWGPDDLEGRIAMASEVAQLGERHGLQEFALEGHVWRLLAFAESGDVVAMDREMEVLERLATELRQPYYLWELDLNRAAFASATGSLDDAELIATRAAERATEAEIADATLAYAVQLFFIRDLQGRLHEIEDALHGFYDEFPQITTLRIGVAYALAELGRIDEAKAVLEPVVRVAHDLPRDRHWLMGIALLAAVCRRTSDSEAAAVVYELLSPYAHRTIVTTSVFSFGSAAHHLGLLAETLGRTDEAVAHLEDAIERHIVTRNRPWQARTSFELGRILAQRGAENRARTLLRSALETASELGMRQVLEEAREMYAQLASVTLAAQGPTSPDHEAAILFTDLVASTELLDRVGDVRSHEILSDHHRIVRKQIVEFGGEEMRFQGDGFMVVFPDARAAISCAVAIQTRVAAYSREHPGTALHVRVGIHSGTPIVEDGDLHGRSVVMASRIAASANGGEILVSRRVRELVDGDVVYGAPRSTSLKGFDGTHALHPVLWG